MADDDITSILLTGPTRGLGRAVVDRLAAEAPGVPAVLLGRDAAVVRGVGAAIGADGQAVDLADLASVRAAADAVVEQVRSGSRPPLTAVILNAGLQVTDRRHRSADGHELTFAVNVLAQHLLIDRLRPALAERSHVVLLGSGTHYGDRRSMGLVAPPRWEDPADLARAGLGGDAAEAVAGQRAYATSKLAVVLLAHAWQRRLGPGQRVNVYDPGLMPGTGLARAMPAWRRAVWHAVMPTLRVLPGVTSPAASARVLVPFALGRTHADLRGGYVDLGRVTRSSDASYDREREERLWEVAGVLTAAGVEPGTGAAAGGA